MGRAVEAVNDGCGVERQRRDTSRCDSFYYYYETITSLISQTRPERSQDDPQPSRLQQPRPKVSQCESTKEREIGHAAILQSLWVSALQSVEQNLLTMPFAMTISSGLP